MKFRKPVRWLLLAVLASLISLLGMLEEISGPLMALPQLPIPVVNVRQPQPPGGPVPSGTADTGTRSDECGNPAIPLLGLTAHYGADYQAGGVTLSAYPTFWLYFPYALQPGLPRTTATAIAAETRMEFELRSLQNPGQKQTIALTATGNPPGIVGFKMPQDLPPLEPSQDYRWLFRIYCNPEKKTAFTTAQGWVRWVDNSSLQQQIQAAPNPRARLKLYQQNSYWYDRVTTLAELRRQTPTDQRLQQDWEQLLQAVDLRDPQVRDRFQQLVQQPIVDFSVTLQPKKG